MNDLQAKKVIYKKW